jgi:radical SAM superfamily enzyme YgiQ (UPF0313 family)
MNISLSTSLHLNHGALTPDSLPGDPLPMQSFMPVGLLSLKAVADSAHSGADIRVIELNGLVNSGQIANDGAFFERIVDSILEPADDLVGLMSDADSLAHSIVIASLVKRRRPDVLVAVGGPAVSPIAEPLLEAFSFIDLVVRGEGEHTFAELIDSLEGDRDLGSVLGLSWRQNGTVRRNEDRPLIADLDELPIIPFEAHGLAPDAPFYMDVGRGCPFKCEFCATAPFWNRKYRMKSIERIVKEMTLVRDQLDRSHVNFSHDIFTCNRSWTRDFCNYLIEHPIGMTWTCSTRTDISQPDILAKMSLAGCVEIYYGIESGSDLVQRQIQKDLDLDWAREIVRATANVGIRPITGFIVGYPFETRDTLGDTLRRFFEFLEVGGVRAHLFTLCPFHESPLYRQHGADINRTAEYFDMPLTAEAGAAVEAMCSEHPQIFSATRRYANPNVPESLVDASEELSAHVVVLKSLWPFLLPHYESALDWYQRWVSWIAAANARRRPRSRFAHQGNAQDILRFVSSELERLGLEDSPVADLAHYERLKLAAKKLPATTNGRKISDGESPLELGDRLAAPREFLCEAFRYDLGRLLARENGASNPSEYWIVVSKSESGELDTIQVGPWTAQILELARHSCSVADLLTLSALPDDLLQLTRELLRRGLLSRVADR